MASTLWEIRLLGGLSLQCGERRESRFRTQKTASLLAFLALFPNRTHPREELAVRFWSEDGDEEARRSLRVSLNSLRRQLETPNASEGELIVADRTTIGLRREAFTTDVFRFEEALTKAARLFRTAPESREERVALLLQAVTVYDAPLLPGFYDDWVLDERERLHSRFLEAIEEAEKLLRKLGRDSEADNLAQRREQSESSDKVAGTGLVQSASRDEQPVAAVSASSAPAIPPPPTNNLPYFFTRFFGREKEIAQIVAHLNDPSVSVITLLGPGGIGKTRLSVEAARAWGKSVVWVPLASVVRGEDIADVLRDALKLPPASGVGDSDWEQITAHLRELSATGLLPILVLDNFEQVEPDSGARFIARLLRAVPGVRCLVSSRRRLGVSGESLLAVETFALPGEDGADPAELLRNPSVALFADRARSTTPDFAVTVRNATAVATLCRLLDGLPLAIELAAAWTSVFTPGQMAQKLVEQGKRWDLLTSRKSADRVERHRCLWNAIAWSYDLLPPDLRKLWRGLSIFHGGFTASMAETVAGDAYSVDGLARLRERSLVRLMEEKEGDDPDEPRYELLESLREFGGERVAEEDSPAAQAALRLRRMATIVDYADFASAQGQGPQYSKFTVRFKRELPNIRQVLNDAEEGRVPLEKGLHLASRLDRLWTSGYIREGYGFLSALLLRADATEETIDDVLQARALFNLAKLIRLRGNYADAGEKFQRALELFRIAGHIGGQWGCLSYLGDLARESRDLDRAEAYIRQSLSLAEGQRKPIMVAECLHLLGTIAGEKHDYVAMREWHERELPLRREIGEVGGIAVAENGMAIALSAQGEIVVAETYSHSALRTFREIGDRMQQTLALLIHGEVMVNAREWERATLAFASGLASARELGIGLGDNTTGDVEAQRSQCQSALGEKTFNELTVWGSGWKIEQGVCFALRETS